MMQLSNSTKTAGPRCDLTPREIVEKLDAFIVGQDLAKRFVAVAIRNRWRRQQIDPAMRDEVAPKNILMSGPTGVGKTEIARRLARLTGAPFIKVEATKYTEVGYYGRDVESMVRELLDNSIALVRQQERVKIEDQAAAAVENTLLDMLVSPPPVVDWWDGQGGFRHGPTGDAGQDDAKEQSATAGDCCRGESDAT